MNTLQKKVRVCFVRLNAYGVIEPHEENPFGGAETRAVTLATSLAAHTQYQVSFLVYEFKRGTRTDHSVQFISGPPRPTREQRASFPSQTDQLVHDGLAKLVASHPTDLYCCVGVNGDSWSVMRSARTTGAKTILFVASDTDLSEKFYKNSSEVGVYGEPGHESFLALTNADEVVVQTEAQQRLLAARFGRTGVLLRNPIDLSAQTYTIKESPHPGPYMLWVGRSDSVQKQPLVFFELARTLPHIQFVAVMTKTDEHTHREVVKAAPDNVTLVDHVPFSDIERYFKYARGFISTSLFEGFPNTFLHAGKYGVPVASLNVDPDHFLTASASGICAEGRLEVLAAQIDVWWNDEGEARRRGKKLKQYIQEHHDAHHIGLDLTGILTKVCANHTL